MSRPQLDDEAMYSGFGLLKTRRSQFRGYRIVNSLGNFEIIATGSTTGSHHLANTQLRKQADKLGANAVTNFALQTESVGLQRNFKTTITGTLVVVEKK